MKSEGKIKGMVYEATLKEGSRIYRIFKEGNLLAECNAKELRYLPQRFVEQGLTDIANDMVDSLPNLKRCTCTICGSEFIGASGRNYTCSEECKQEAHRNRSREVAKKSTKDQNLLHVREAERLGMSYGKYMAMLYIQNGGARVEI